MQPILLSIHLIVAIALVAVILLQRSEGGALGIGGGQGGMFTARGAGNMLTKTTKWLAVVFLSNSLLLGWLAAQDRGKDAVLETAIEQQKDDGCSQLPEMPTVPEDGN